MPPVSLSREHANSFFQTHHPPRCLPRTHTSTRTHTHTTEQLNRVSQITRCYGNSAATHQRERRAGTKEIGGVERWTDKDERKGRGGRGGREREKIRWWSKWEKTTRRGRKREWWKEWDRKEGSTAEEWQRRDRMEKIGREGKGGRRTEKKDGSLHTSFRQPLIKHELIKK